VKAVSWRLLPGIAISRHVFKIAEKKELGGCMAPPEVEPIADSVLRDLLSYWLSKRRLARFPGRADIDPIEIPELLPHIILTDVMPDGRYRYRLTGASVDTNATVALAGKYIEEAFTERAYIDYINSLFDYVGRGQIIYTEGEFRVDREVSIRGVKRIGLPLSSDGARVDVALVGQVYQFGNIARGLNERQDHRTWRETFRRVIDPATL
jgi:hypothetical protein